MHVAAFLLDEQEARHDLPFGLLAADVAIRRSPVGGVVTLSNLAEAYEAPVVHGHRRARPDIVVGLDPFGRGDEVGAHDLEVSLPGVHVALGGALVIVEGHAWRDDVHEREALVGQARLEDREELVPVAGEAARDEARAQGQRHQHGVDRSLDVRLAPLRQGSHIGRRGELPLGEAVHAVVLDEVEHVEVAANGVAELAEADGQGVSIARHPNVDHLPVGRVRAGGNRRHAPVNTVEAMGLAQKVSRRLGGASDSAELDGPVGSDVQVEERLGDRRRDRVVAASGAQGGHRPLVVAAGHTERVLLKARMANLRFGLDHVSFPASCSFASTPAISRVIPSTT